MVGKGRRRMNIVLLSGGSWKRLWPLSNDIRSKQFIKIFKGVDGCYDLWFKEYIVRSKKLIQMQM